MVLCMLLFHTKNSAYILIAVPRMFVLQVVDFEDMQGDTMSINIRVSDGQNQDSASIAIDVLDVNDNAPEFDTESQLQNVTVFENEEVGFQVAVVEASDPDTNEGGQFE